MEWNTQPTIGWCSANIQTAWSKWLVGRLLRIDFRASDYWQRGGEQQMGLSDLDVGRLHLAPNDNEQATAALQNAFEGVLHGVRVAEDGAILVPSSFYDSRQYPMETLEITRFVQGWNFGRKYQDITGR